MREELELKYKRDIKTRDELIELLKAKVSVVPSARHSDELAVSVTNGRELRSSGGGSCDSEVAEDPSRSGRLKLPTLPKFSGDDRDDVDSLKRWLAKLEKHAELQCWTEREKLVQFELHLAGRAERVYEILPSQVKESYVKATEALQERLNPVEREALVSAQLMRRKQQQNESVDEFAQDLEKLFERILSTTKLYILTENTNKMNVCIPTKVPLKHPGPLSHTGQLNTITIVCKPETAVKPHQ